MRVTIIIVFFYWESGGLMDALLPQQRGPLDGTSQHNNTHATYIRPMTSRPAASRCATEPQAFGFKSKLVKK